MTQDLDQAAIATVLEARAQAIRAKDADAALAHQAPGFVRYDLAPPLATIGGAALERDRLTAWFATWRGPIPYELRDVAITPARDPPFAYGFLRLGGTKTDGYEG